MASRPVVKWRIQDVAPKIRNKTKKAQKLFAAQQLYPEKLLAVANLLLRQIEKFPMFVT